MDDQIISTKVLTDVRVPPTGTNRAVSAIKLSVAGVLPPSTEVRVLSNSQRAMSKLVS
jgi:hypothetical protein